jgi:hypothetical protein
MAQASHKHQTDKTMHIATIKVSTKKGHEQTTRWHVSKSRPYPDRDDRGEWRNAGDMLPRDKSKPSIGNEYRCFLLRSDFDPAAMATGNRNDHAGFSPGLVYVEGKRVMQPELPGTIELRGKSLGEMNIVFGNNPEWPDITVRGYGNAPTTAERDWIKAEIIPALRQFIADNADSLKAQAVAELKKDTAARLASYRADIDRMEAQMQAAIAAL